MSCRACESESEMGSLLNCSSAEKKNDCSCESSKGRSKSSKKYDCDGGGGGGGRKSDQKCFCRGNESFEKWKKEILSKASKKGACGDRKNGKQSHDNEKCKYNKKQENNCGCSCCSFIFCAAALLAAGVAVSFIKKKYID